MTIDIRQFSSDKIFKHLDMVNIWLKGGNPPPVTVELDMTNICNHKCPECTGMYFQNRNGEYLPDKLAANIIKQLAEAEIRGLIFTGGGEPLCHPYTMEALKSAYRLGLDIGFITNGSLITKGNAKVLLECCTWVRVSLDAASPRIFKKIHGLDGNAFINTLGNIRTLVRMKNRLKSKTVIGLGYLTSDYTKQEILKMSILGKELGVDYLQFRPLLIHNKGKFQYHHNDIMKLINKSMKQSNSKYKVLFSKHKYDMMGDKEFGRNYKRCYGHQFATVIAADAKMYLCCHMRGFKKYCIGDLRRNTFKEIWDSKKRKRVSENIDFGDCVPLCRDNTFNQILWNIKQPREHINFL